MEIKTRISLQTKQVLSQVQMESLNILSMSVTELQEFLQTEEIENPLMEYSADRQEAPVTFREYDRFYNGSHREGSGDGELYQVEDEAKPVDELVYTQLHLNAMGDDRKKVVDYCIQSLESSGYLPLSLKEISDDLKISEPVVTEVLDMLKKLEPRGIFASGLEECLTLQVRGMEQEAELETIIREHLNDVADGKISNISRSMKLNSTEVRRLIHIIKGLNPRPLNGYGKERIQYVFPDILLSCQDGQWTMELNDKWMGSVGINEFYVHMMETARDDELKNYFEEKLKRARFIMNAVEQRRRTLLGITESIINRQAGWLSGKESLRPMTLEEIAVERGIHKSTVSRAIRDKYLLAPAGCVLIRDLFTTGVSYGGEGDVSRNEVKAKIKELVEQEDKHKPLSDERLAQFLEEAGILVSRRTVAKYRTELEIGSAFQRKEGW